MSQKGCCRYTIPLPCFAEQKLKKVWARQRQQQQQQQQQQQEIKSKYKTHTVNIRLNITTSINQFHN